MLVHMSVIYVDNISHFGLSACFLPIKKVSRVLVCSFRFYARAAFYISGLENKNKYSTSKIALLFFKIFSIKVYALLHRDRSFRSTRAFFWAIDKLCGIQRKQFFFDSQMFMQYWMYATPANALGCLNLTIGHMTILQYQLAYSINGFRNKNWFWTTFLQSTTTSVEFTIPAINSSPWWSFIAKNWIKCIDALLFS